jgi:hypothetical protein
MAAQKWRYCRLVFKPKTGGPQVEVDFGFLSAQQKADSIQRLRRLYDDHHFTKCYAIDSLGLSQHERATQCAS